MRRIGYKLATLLAAYVAWVMLLAAELGGELTDTLVTMFGPLPLAMVLLTLDDHKGGPASLVRTLAPALVPGILAGLALGLALRAAMRVVALAAGVTTSFTVSGTLTVLLIFAVLGAAYGVLLTAVWRSLPGFRPAPGLIGGTALAVWFCYPFFMAAVGDLDEIPAPLIILLATLLSSTWIGYGLMFAALMRRGGSLPDPIV